MEYKRNQIEEAIFRTFGAGEEIVVGGLRLSDAGLPNAAVEAFQTLA